MSRMIDADVLKSNMFNCAPPEMTWDRGDIEHKIDEMPTVDAIPVEWLEAHETEYIDDWGYEPVSIGMALNMWQKEQEAKK